MNKTQIKTLIEIALECGEIALKYFDQSELVIDKKSDNSPVTKADQEISNFIKLELERHFPDISIICEEGINRKIGSNKFWLIDPIDGTKEFIRKTPYFTINIGLIEDNQPVFGLIYAPKISGSPLYYIDGNGHLMRLLVETGELTQITNNSKTAVKKIISSKRSSDAEVLEFVKNNFAEIDCDKIEITKMSSSLKFCEFIKGKADLFLSLNSTMEWDTAAGHALVLAAGAKVFNLDQKSELTYNKAGFINKGFIAKF